MPVPVRLNEFLPDTRQIGRGRDREPERLAGEAGSQQAGLL